MDRLNRLSRVLQSIETLSTTIIDATPAILEEISQEESQIISRLQEQHDGMTEDQARQLAYDAVLTIGQDARNVADELGDFSQRLAANEDVGEYQDTPFLNEVWFGDTYDQSELEGLKSLEAELNRQMISLNPEGVAAVVQAQLETE